MSKKKKNVYLVCIRVSQSDYTEGKYYTSAADTTHIRAVFMNEAKAMRYAAKLKKQIDNSFCPESPDELNSERVVVVEMPVQASWRNTPTDFSECNETYI